MARSKYKVANMSELGDETQKDKISIEPTNVEMSTPGTETNPETAQAPIEAKVENHKGQTGRSKRYTEALSKIDRTRTYALKEAVKILKSLPQPKFDTSVEAHAVLRDIIPSVDVAYPHSTGKTLRVAIFSDDMIPLLEKAQLDFDVLIATPAQMSKLTKFARLLGPKGLMPNPKNGTLVPDPAKRQKELESGKVTIRAEKKAPLLHTIVGKSSMTEVELLENIQALVAALSMKATKLTICTSMSPGIKVSL